MSGRYGPIGPHPFAKGDILSGTTNHPEGTGRVVATAGGDEARTQIDKLAYKYTGAAYANPIGRSGRLILRIAADKANTAASVMGR